MVKITDGQQILTVTHSAYLETFKRAGYKMYNDTHTPEQAQDATGQPKQQPKEYGKPISQWTRRELMEYLMSHGQVADGKTDELRAAVKAHLEDA